MTFLAPAALPPSFASYLRPLAPARRVGRVAVANEDGARKAMGADHQMPAAIIAGVSMENLARIALG